MKKLLGIHADIWGALASFTCALHCSILPLLLAMGSFSAFAWMQNEWVELAFLASAVVFSIWSILPTFIKDPSKKGMLFFMIGGLVLLTFGYITHVHDGNIKIVSVIGGLFLCLAHLMNFKFQNQEVNLSSI